MIGEKAADMVLKDAVAAPRDRIEARAS
jgi:hypothetical protein